VTPRAQIDFSRFQGLKNIVALHEEGILPKQVIALRVLSPSS